ncbi:MAG: exonuclease SbcCD subunit D [Dehalococcoidia bacterium]|nr:exonuclease SbcCD subunit D [Dehalococcoidia bacterium]
MKLMRILHFADLHIGVELYGRPLPGKPWSSRMQDFLDAFDFLVDYAVEEHVDAVIFAGDAYKAREPSQTHQREFARRIRRLSEANIATFLLVGNHDLPNAESRAHALEIFRTLNVPNVTVGDAGWFQREGHVPQVIETRAGPLQVAFVPWPQVSQLLASSEEAESASIEQLYKLIERAISDLVVAQGKQIDPDVPAILTCHLPLSDQLVAENKGSEYWMQSGTVPRVPLSALHMDNVDYVALGHHHNAMQLNAHPPCWYSGALQEVDFGDARTAKGFMTLELDTSRPRGERLTGSGAPRLVKAPSRRFVTIAVNPRDADPNEEVLAAIGKHDVTDAIVKVEVHLDRDQETLLRLSEARSALADAHVIAGIRTVLPDENRSPLPPNIQPDASSPVETLDTYLKLREVADERRERLLAAAAEIIEESEVVGV